MNTHPLRDRGRDRSPGVSATAKAAVTAAMVLSTTAAAGTSRAPAAADRQRVARVPVVLGADIDGLGAALTDGECFVWVP